MAVDVERRRPVLSTGSGGLSGPAIKPMAVHLVSRVARAVKVPLIGIGGISTGADALEFILAGASAVQVGTATFAEPAACVRILREIEEYCARHAIEDLSSLVGALQT
jgi:dihydroorotate dehydrogenase (NAD+) catalytic subunit